MTGEFLVGAGICLCHHAQTNSGALQALYPMDTRGKVAGV